MKTLLPFFPIHTQKILSILYKLMELLDIIRFYNQLEQHNPNSAPPLPFTTENLMESIKGQLNPEEKERFESAFHMIQMMNMLQAMEASQEKEPSDLSQLLKGMLSPEQQSMFDTISAMFPEREPEPDSEKKEE